MMARKKDESKVVGVVYYCANLDKEIILKDIEYAFISIRIRL